MLTGSLYVADSLESGVAISGYKNSGFVRSLGYDGFAAGYPGFLLWSGSALSGSAGSKGGAPYSGVGLELYLNNASYFRYSTSDDEIYIATDNFFFGNPNGTYISGSNGNLEISSSGFVLNAAGDVTASSIVTIGPTGTVLFDSNNEYADAVNIGRVVHFNRDEYTYTGAPTPIAQTASIFETFILPGETSLQASFMYEFTPFASATGILRSTWYIQYASITGSGTTTGYDLWSTPEQISSTTQISDIPTVAPDGGARNLLITAGGYSTTFENYQGRYVRIYMIVERSSAWVSGDILKFKGFVYRTSRLIGSSVNPLPNPIRQ